MSDIPKHIGRYSVESLIGEGGMAKVYLGHAHSASGFTRPVALKVLQPHLRGNARFERMLIGEARWGGKLYHDGLVPTYELGLHEGSYFVCMEYVPGFTLAELATKISIPQAMARFIVARIALALEYVHTYADEDGKRVGLVHRDVTPSNVIISKAGHVKLVDFGIAKATSLSSETQGNLLKGTYAYMSPEQITGDTLTAQSDIFSLGALFYELLTGNRAFDGETVHETMRRVRECEWSWTGKAPAAEYIPIVERSLQRECDLRFESAGALCEALGPLERNFSALKLATLWPDADVT
jgi:serine/threonine protein kinase